MFSKERDLAERSKTLLKNKEVRTFKAEILKQFPNVQEDELSLVIPNKANVNLTKLANKTLLYSLDGIILFFDVEGRNNLYPSLNFLWKFPNTLKSFVVHAPVSQFLLKGADLMTPGLFSTANLDGITVGEKLCVRVRGNPMPFAVGDSSVNWISLQKCPRRGKALSVLHVYGDLIASKSPPNSGFRKTCIYSIDNQNDENINSDDDDDEQDNFNDNSLDIETVETSCEVELPNSMNNIQLFDGLLNNGCENHLYDNGSVDNGSDCDVVDDENREDILCYDSVDVDDNIEHSDQSFDEIIDNTTCSTDAVSQVKTKLHDKSNSKNNNNNATATTSEVQQQQPVMHQQSDANIMDEIASKSCINRGDQDTLLLQAVLLATKYIIKEKQLPMLASTYWAIVQR